MADSMAMEGAAHRGLASATRTGDDALRLNALRMLAAAKVMQGKMDAGRALAWEGLAEARRLGLRIAEARLLILQNVPHHREIVAAWARRPAGAEGMATTAG